MSTTPFYRSRLKCRTYLALGVFHRTVCSPPRYPPPALHACEEDIFPAGNVVRRRSCLLHGRLV